MARTCMVAPDGTFTPFPNGFAVFADGNHITFASTTLGQVLFYDCDPATDDLMFSHGVCVPFLPDNLYYADDGALVITNHPLSCAHVSCGGCNSCIRTSWAVVLCPISTPCVLHPRGLCGEGIRLACTIVGIDNHTYFTDKRGRDAVAERQVCVWDIVHDLGGLAYRDNVHVRFVRARDVGLSSLSLKM
ncbi:hypothetical protein V8B97DRAFT_311610 [Scleroderma yunnanense]